MLLRARFSWVLVPSLTASLGAAACGTNVKGTSGGTTGTGAGGASSECPADTPSNGSACAGGATCHYPTPCCEDTVATCTGGKWAVQEGACEGVLPKPPPPSCPEDQPAEGSSCAGSCLGPTTCQYGTCPGSMAPAVLATCEGTWSITVQCDGGAGGGAGGGG
jgi:hypothetical protein